MTNWQSYRLDKLYYRAYEIMEGRMNGLYRPILQHLASRNHVDAMLLLADKFDWHGGICHRGSASNLLHRAYKLGSDIAAQHMAMNAFNQGDLLGYRRWLSCSARLGDLDARSELQRFETRLPHVLAGQVRRKRPLRKYEYLT
jgi:predicted metal-dependent peptidase